MFVTLVRLTMHTPHCQSRKDRRSVVRKIKDRVGAKLKVVIAEVGGQETWQRIDLGFAVVGPDGGFCDSRADDGIRMIDELDLGRRVDLQRARSNFGELRDVDGSQ